MLLDSFNCTFSITFARERMIVIAKCTTYSTVAIFCAALYDIEQNVFRRCLENVLHCVLCLS